MVSSVLIFSWSPSVKEHIPLRHLLPHQSPLFPLPSHSTLTPAWEHLTSVSPLVCDLQDQMVRGEWRRKCWNRWQPLTSLSIQRKECDLPDWSWQGLPIDRYRVKDLHHCSSSSSTSPHRCDLHFSSKVFFQVRKHINQAIQEQKRLIKLYLEKHTFYFILHQLLNFGHIDDFVEVHHLRFLVMKHIQFM